MNEPDDNACRMLTQMCVPLVPMVSLTAPPPPQPEEPEPDSEGT